jgi:hypothetical protein
MIGAASTRPGEGESVRRVEETDGTAEFLVVALIASDLPTHVGTLVDVLLCQAQGTSVAQH